MTYYVVICTKGRARSCKTLAKTGLALSSLANGVALMHGIKAHDGRGGPYYGIAIGWVERDLPAGVKEGTPNSLRPVWL